MKIYKYVLKIESGFSLKETIESQFFRYKMINKNLFLIQTKDYVGEIKYEPKNKTLVIKSNKNSKSYWENFFDIKTQYKKILKEINKNAPIKTLINNRNTIRILIWDPFEAIISFIFSQNNNIKRIRNNLNDFCKIFGKKITFLGETYYTFPSIDDFLNNKPKKLNQLKKIKLGYRYDYIKNLNADLKNVIKNLNLLRDECFNFYKFKSTHLDMEIVSTTYKDLINIKGIGDKVANCILLFGAHALYVFPVDTWIKKGLKELLDYEYKNKSDFNDYLESNFKKYGGLAQQYIFYYYISKNSL